MLRTRALLDEVSGWQTVVDNYNGVSTFHRSEEDTPIHSLKVIGIIDAPIQLLLSLIIEADLIPTFIDFIKIEVRQLRIKSVYHQLLYQKVPLPWPLSTRDIVIEAQGFDELEEEGDLVITGQSVERFEDVKIPQTEAGDTRLKVHLAGGRIRPITMNKAEVTVVANVDFQMYLPNGIVNWLAKTLAYYAFVQFRSKATSTSGNGAHDRRIKEKKEVYEQVMEPVIKFLLSKEKKKTDDAKQSKVETSQVKQAEVESKQNTPPAISVESTNEKKVKDKTLNSSSLETEEGDTTTVNDPSSSAHN